MDNPQPMDQGVSLSAVRIYPNSSHRALTGS